MAANTTVLISRMGDTAVCVTMVTCWHQTEDTVKVIRISKERTACKVLGFIDRPLWGYFLRGIALFRYFHIPIIHLVYPPPPQKSFAK